jgi:SAM-dependent methyltransferase
MEDWNDPAFAREWTEENTAGPHSPLRDEQIGILIDILRAHFAATGLPARVLDVGCGPGVVAARILDDVAGSEVTGVDGSPTMLELAGERMAPYARRYRLARADFEAITPADVPAGPYGAAVAVQAIHNSSDDGKRRTFAAARAAMATGGLFLLCDRVRVPSPGVFPAYLALWDRLDAGYRERGWEHHEGRSYAAHALSVERRGDKPGSLEQNILWLREAGFAEVAPIHVVGIRAIVAAIAG